MKKFFNSFAVVSFFMISQHLSAQTQLASLFNNHMVLQRNSQIAIWGYDKPNSKITVNATWGSKAQATANAAGKWETKLATTQAGGPYQIKVNGSSSINLTDVLLGEVWLCSGQSNMEMPVKGFRNQPVENSNQLILNSNNNQIRFFNVVNKISTTPLDSCKGYWEAASFETIPNFSAIAYVFGKMLQENLDVPIGLVTSDWGGTVAQAWMDNQTLKAGFNEIKLPADADKNINQNTPTALYNGMINPLIPFTFKGVIWYQGESNRLNAAQYQKLFPALINSWRAQFLQPNLPFYFVQIAPFTYNNQGNSAGLREAQLKTMLTVKNTGMVSTLDIGTADFIHPPKKIEVGERLALWALGDTYGFKGITYSGPVYKSFEIENNKAIISFDYADMGLSSFGQELADFEIAGADKKFYPAKAVIKNTGLEVTAEEVFKPVAVRYGWKNYLKGTLFNTAGLPASSFRTDDWD
jgi:sialate O-acetylesterase